MAKQQHIEMVPPTGAKQLHSTPELLITSKTPIMTNWVGIGALCSRPSPPIISVPRFWPRKIKSVSMAIPVKRYWKQQSMDKHVSNIFKQGQACIKYFQDLFLSREMSCFFGVQSEMSRFFGFRCNVCLLIAVQLWLVLAFLLLECFTPSLLCWSILMSYRGSLAFSVVWGHDQWYGTIWYGLVLYGVVWYGYHDMVR